MQLLLDHLLALRPDAGSPNPEERAVAARILADALSRCATAWPTLTIAREQFASYIGVRLSRDASLVDALVGLRIEELYLAFACAHQHARALSLFHHHYLSHIDAAVAEFGVDASARDDLRQLVLDRLFVADAGKVPHVASYAGLGSLTAWVRVTSRRVAINATRRRDPLRERRKNDDVMQLPGALGDPELEHLAATYSTEFRAALTDAARMLTARQRTLLKHSIVGALNVRQIGRMYGVHHATAARWISVARTDLIAHTRTMLAHRLNVSGSELQSLMLVLQSRVDVTVSRIWRGP